MTAHLVAQAAGRAVAQIERAKQALTRIESSLPAWAEPFVFGHTADWCLEIGFRCSSVEQCHELANALGQVTDGAEPVRSSSSWSLTVEGVTVNLFMAGES